MNGETNDMFKADKREKRRLKTMSAKKEKNTIYRT